jgi:iron complex transport system ATP-binding protein
MIEAESLALAYGDTVVLHDVSMQVVPGEVVAIIGPNGAGKSTLLRALGGQHHPHAGSVRVDGAVLERVSATDRARRVALIEADNAAIENISVREVVALGRLPHRPWWRWNELPSDEAVVEDALARAQLSNRAERPVATLSSGERQRAWVALALAQQAPVLLFDEPTSHLDLRNAMQMLGLLRELADANASIVLVLHDLNLAAAHADRVAILGEGTLLAYDVPERVFNEDTLSRAYGAPILVRSEGDALLAFAQPPPRRRAIRKEGPHAQHLDP